MQLEYLPPYLPNFNPIEEMFSCMKSWMCSDRDFVHSELTRESSHDAYSMIWRVVLKAVTLEKVAGWYWDCGYV